MGVFNNLTQKIVNELKPKEIEYIIWDDEVAGLGLRVWPTGKKTYILKYRTKEGRQRKPVIAGHGEFTLKQARDIANEYKRGSRFGNDLLEKKREEQNSLTLKDFFEKYQEYSKKRKKKSVNEDKSIFDNRILPKLGGMKINSINRRDVHQLHQAMHETPYLANRVLALLSTIFNMAEVWSMRKEHSNPCKHVKRYPEQKRERFLGDDELKKLLLVLEHEEAIGTESKYVTAAIRLLLLTGCRREEILRLKWDYIDFDNSCFHLPDSKTGAKTVYVPMAALNIIRSLEKQPDNPYVIVGRKDGRRLVNISKPWYRIRLLAGCQDLRIHDLRHSFASIAVSNGISLPMIGALLGHTQPSTTARYSHLANEAMLNTANFIAEKILLNGNIECLNLKTKTGEMRSIMAGTKS